MKNIILVKSNSDSHHVFSVEDLIIIMPGKSGIKSEIYLKGTETRFYSSETPKEIYNKIKELEE